MNEIVEIGKAQDLILGQKRVGTGDSGTAPLQLEIADSEEDE